ncbi:hypothetical protein EK904_003356 [Melospiza melodia maxima]|nr:hypothetical protein EK904_003356 [Melospiza melodia maxima]
MNFGLVVTDLFGHLINGAIAVFVYASDKDWIRFNQSNILCSVFGICMVFFGLCPLFLGSVMAVERCIGVTKPIFHSTKMTSRHVKMMLTMVVEHNSPCNLFANIKEKVHLFEITTLRMDSLTLLLIAQ